MGVCLKVKRKDSLEGALELVGKKYDLQIIDSIRKNKGRARFNEILSDISKINPRILSIRLKDLEKNNLVTKNIILGTPIRTEYALTKKSEELIEIIENLKNWFEKK